MTDRLDLPQRYRSILEGLLREHVPDAEVWAYGSRITGESHEGSDLDLVVRGPGLEPLGDGFFSLLEAIEESNIPILVQAHDWALLPESFHPEIERDYVVVQGDQSGTESRWTATTWGELATLEYGKSLRGYDSAEGPYRVYGTNGPIGKNNEPLCRHASVIIGRKGAYRGVHYSPDPFFVIDTAFYMKPKVDLDTRWAYYQLLTQDINGLDSGSAIPSTSREDFYGLPVEVPPLKEQRAIAHVLGTLDDKIELNRRMNETLEDMARALFKSWFVDFDPVHAKAALSQTAGSSSRAHPPITPPLGGSRQDEGVSPTSRRWGDIRRKYTRETLEKARSLRQTQTDAEGLLWHYLRNKRLGGYKFRRQHPMGKYIADFVCLSRKLIIELDGGHHAKENDYDEERDRFLQNEGYRVMRFWNNEILESCMGVLEKVFDALEFPPPPPEAATPPQGGSDGEVSSGWTIERARAYLDKMDPSIAALFPDRFVDSELGEIPEGWEVKALGDVANQRRNGLTPEQIDPSAPYIGLEHMPQRSIALSEWTNADGLVSGKSRFEEGDILFGKLRPYFHKVGVAPVEGVCSTDIVVISPISAHWFGVVLGHTSSKQFVDYTDAASTGTRMPRTKWKDMALYGFALPGVEIACGYNALIQPWIERMLSAIHECRMLAKQRVELLPRLVSGIVRIG